VERFERLLNALEQGDPSPALAQELFERDKVFPEINFQWFEA
jgi:hypothetical protein